MPWDLVTETLSPQGPCHRDLVTGTFHRGYCHGTLSLGPFYTGSLSWGPCHGDRVMGLLSWDPVAGLCRGAESRRPRNRGARNRDFVTEFHGPCLEWLLVTQITKTLPDGTSSWGLATQGPCRRDSSRGLLSRGFVIETVSHRVRVAGFLSQRRCPQTWPPLSFSFWSSAIGAAKVDSGSMMRGSWALCPGPSSGPGKAKRIRPCRGF
mmetsp:Transcript_13472/g.47171  ORF Transcript_13472/g.47171 Transcript_13472/m.47171 type:complete len:208 (-) Transcript_13472:160-783(-)